MVSSIVHAAFVLAAARIAVAAHAPEDAEPEPPAADAWLGETFEISEPGSPTAGGPGAPQGDPGPDQARSSSQPAAAEPAAVAPAAPAAVPAPLPLKPRKPRSGPAASGQPSIQTGAAASGGPASSGTFGMSGQGVGGPRNLGRAFTRAVPIAISPDPVWAAMAPGPAGSFDLRVELGEDGRIVSARPIGAVSEHLRALGARTIALLGAGTFAIQAEPGAGAQVLRISATVSMVDGSAPDDASRAGAYGLGFEPPARDRPGKAWFTLRSGKHVEITVRVMAAP